MNFKDLKVGDEVYLVESDKRQCNPRYVKVVKVGRKYIHVNKLNGSTDNLQKIVDWNNDGWAIAIGNDYPQCVIYPTKEIYEEKKLWKAVKSLLSSSYTDPEGLTQEHRKQIIEVLKDLL